MTGFLYIKSHDEILNIEDIIQISYEPDEETLEIFLRDSNSFSTEGSEAEELFLQLITRLPDLVVVGDKK